MNRIIAIAFMTAAVAFPVAAQAEGADGSRQAAGGGFMSSYVDGPYHDPRSRLSQRNGSGQILGQPSRAGAGRRRRRDRAVRRCGRAPRRRRGRCR
ncbi:hypothetical protein [Methylorubrum populi]|uniref:hypothetical protein n=1 Tax=Methylorubrum populi TaxID=223967 RepID=UPI003AF68DE1